MESFVKLVSVFLFKKTKEDLKMNEKVKYELVKFVDEEFELEVNVSPKEETIWLSQEQIIVLYHSTKQNVSFYINNILKEGELDDSTVKEILTVRLEGNMKIQLLQKMQQFRW